MRRVGITCEDSKHVLPDVVDHSEDSDDAVIDS